jgi:hypothetical protein
LPVKTAWDTCRDANRKRVIKRNMTDVIVVASVL